MSKVFKSKIIYILIFISMMFTLVSRDWAVEANSIEWMQYSDILDQESDIAWEHPELYVGCNATFDTITYSKFLIGNLVDDKIEQYGNAVLEEGSDSLRNIGANYVVTITDYFYEESTNTLWYKVEAAEGYSLPQAFIENPYVKYASNYTVDGWPPAVTLQMLPKKAMVRNETLTINNSMTTASAFKEIDKANVPATFDVTYVYSNTGSYAWYGYDLGDISSWGLDIDSTYHYVNEDEVIIIPVAVTTCYDKLLNAEGTQEYNEILESIPQDILDMFSPFHKEDIENRYEELVEIENVEYSTTVMINGISVPVSVKGKIPQEGVKLSVSIVDFDTVVNEGFRVKEITDLIAALDIKILNIADDSEWQPEENNYIEVSIGLSALGYEDGRIFQLEHKHGDRIDYYEIFIVIDGKLTITVDGFSIFTVQAPLGTTNAQRIGNNGTNLTLTVGETKVYYFTTANNGVNDNTPGRPSKWAVSDPEGAIHYTVHAEGNTRNDGVKAPWIKVTALKPTCDSMSATGNPINDSPVELRAQWNNNRTGALSNLTITPPKAQAGVDNGKKLYLKDTVNTSGKITATLVNTNGQEITDGLDGAAFTWTRSDGMFITPRAYADDYQSVNIAIDHAGLVEARKNDGEYTLVTYTVSALLADGNTVTAEYTVYYQSEILNAGFEDPRGTNSNYTFFVNGAPNLYWKTTAPGPDGNLTRDIEVANFNGGTCSQSFGVTKAAEGIQFAELNAEAFGALYQDIITAPGENIDWQFAHAPRDATNFGNHNFSNAMFIIIGATENAQKLTTQQHLEALNNAAWALGEDNTKFTSGKEAVTVTNFTYNGVNYGNYKVWYHDAGHALDDDTQYVWTDLEGYYNVPQNQYRTRLFFVSKTNTRVVNNSTNPNGGNLIDKASAGQYKDVLIEYYEESYGDNNAISLTHLKNYDQTKKALVYSNMPIEYLDELETGSKHDYLHRILINGSLYPYDVRYSGQPSIYIENYPEDKLNNPLVDPFPDSGKDYTQYDIVVQIYVRDTVIAMQKKIEFPTTEVLDSKGEVVKDGEGNPVLKELMTIEQKLELMDSLTEGYNVDLTVYTDETNSGYVTNTAEITIKNPDPKGNYTGHITPDNNPILGYKYRVQETDVTELTGLELSKVRFDVHGYRYGSTGKVVEVSSSTITLVGEELTNLISPQIKINDFKIDDPTHPDYGYKIADVVITNIYTEKLTKINYRAIGSGKLKHVPEGTNPADYPFVDTPSETLAFYSGKAIGCLTYPSTGAQFDGWYRLCRTDETPDLVKVASDDTILNLKRVTAADGIYDAVNHSFKPNANIISTDEITFYAVFETKSVKITKTNGEPNQTYIYRVQGNDGLDIEVSLKCDENGNGFVDIYEVDANTVTVTEVTAWTWRDYETKTKQQSFGTNMLLTFDFNRTQSLIDYWLNGYGPVVPNVYTKPKPEPGGS